MKDCIFCKIVNGKLPAKRVYEDADLFAFHDIHPSAPVHILIVPKKHISQLSKAEEADVSLLGKIQLAAAKIAKEFNIDDAFRLQVLNGSKAGQNVFHLHYHLRGGWKKALIEL